MAIDVEANPSRVASHLTKELLQKVIETYQDFDYCKDSMYRNVARPAIFWPDGSSIGYGFASHISGTAQKFYEKFRYWGFDGLKDFYCLPVEIRNAFLKRGKSIWKSVFASEEFKETLEAAKKIDDLDLSQQRAILSLLQKQEAEFHGKLVTEARKIRQECYAGSQYRRRIDNEKARFYAEDELRERTEDLSESAQMLARIKFEVSESVKKAVGLRERNFW